jgi:hypothetical protein
MSNRSYFCIENIFYSQDISLIWSRITAAFSNSQAFIASSNWIFRSFKIIAFSAFVALFNFFVLLSWVSFQKDCSRSKSVLTVSSDFTFDEARVGVIQCSLLNFSWILRRR